MMFFSVTVARELGDAAGRGRRRALRPILAGSSSKIAAMLKPWSAKIGEPAIAPPSRPAPIRAMLCCPEVRRMRRISRDQRVDVVADAALAELAEGREVAADLRRVDVRVLGDVLRRDRRAAHLLRLRQDLQVAREARCDTDRETFGHGLLSCAIPRPPRRRGAAPTACDRSIGRRGLAPQRALRRYEARGRTASLCSARRRAPARVGRRGARRPARRRSRPPGWSRGSRASSSASPVDVDRVAGRSPSHRRAGSSMALAVVAQRAVRRPVEHDLDGRRLTAAPGR